MVLCVMKVGSLFNSLMMLLVNIYLVQSSCIHLYLNFTLLVFVHDIIN